MSAWTVLRAHLLNWRTLNSTPRSWSSRGGSKVTNVSLYASVGSELTHYDVDVAGAALTRRATIDLPASVQYVWPHASRRFLYAATSDSAPGMGPPGTNHHV